MAERGENLDEAVRLIEEAVRLDPGHAANYYDSLSFAHLQRGDGYRALEASDRGIAASPNLATHVSLLDRRASAHRILGDADAETQTLKQILELQTTGSVATAARTRLLELGVQP